MENINKENYFRPQWMERYPLASKNFCEWMDNYKLNVGWKELFLDLEDRPSPEFHEIPLEMQHGILSRYFIQYDSSWWLSFAVLEKYGPEHLFSELELYFGLVEKLLMQDAAQQAAQNNINDMNK